MCCESELQPGELEGIQVLPPERGVDRPDGGAADDAVLTVQNNQAERGRTVENWQVVRRWRPLYPKRPPALELLVEPVELVQVKEEIATGPAAEQIRIGEQHSVTGPRHSVPADATCARPRDGYIVFTLQQ